MEIVSNFGKIHSDLQELKTEYIQEQQNNLVQTGDTMSPEENLQIQLSSEEKLMKLKTELQDKQSEILEIVQDFRKMHADLYNIKNNFDEDRANQQVELSMLKNKSNGHKRSHKKRHSVKASLNKNLKKAHTAEFEIWS